VSRLPVSEDELWRQAEKKVVCSCGLIQAGYHAGWAVKHAEKCLVTTLFRVLLVKLAEDPDHA